MRINLFQGGKRPLTTRIMLGLLKRRIGTVPGPMVTLTYRPDLLNRELNGYILRGMHGYGGWSKGEAELFAAFVSNLNRCHF